MPKALADSGSGPWVRLALDALQDCVPRVVVVGAARDEVLALLPDAVLAVDNPDHDAGMGSSLRVGLRALLDPETAHPPPDAVLVMLVDLPGVGLEVVRRVCAAVGDGSPADVLARAAFDGVPGHPVLLGRRHWPGVIDSASGDSGARLYLAEHRPILVECADIGSGIDVDTPGRLER
jgi:CTP:molybdopterin cytidylyltransferase MocA